LGGHGSFSPDLAAYLPDGTAGDLVPAPRSDALAFDALIQQFDDF